MTNTKEMTKMQKHKPRGMTRRTFLRGLALVGGSALALPLIQACAPGAAPAAPAVPAATAAPAAEAAAETVDVRVLWSKPTIISPLFSSSGFEQQVNRLVLGSVYKMSANLEPVPDLADSWEVNEDSTAFTFHLREGLQWNDGTPLTVDDIIFTIERSADARTGSLLKGRMANIVGSAEFADQTAETLAGLERVDDLTLTIHLAQPDAAFLTAWGMFSGFCVLPKHALEVVAPEAMKEHAFSMAPTVGAGAYNFVRYETDQYAELVANPNYWGEKPAVDRIFMTIATPDVAVAQLERGELDLMAMPVDEADRLKDAPNITILSVRSPSISQIGINNEREYFKDKRVRQAMMYAIDRQGIVESIMFGEAEVVNTTVIGPEWAGTPEVNPYPYDPEQAKTLLAEAGWDPNQEVEMIYVAGAKEQDAYGPVIQQQLTEAGMKTNLVLVEGAELRRRYIEETDFDLFLFGGGQYRAEPSLTANYYHSRNLTPAGGNGTHYVNPELDELLDAAVAVTDKEQRKEIYDQIAKIVNEDVPTVFLWSPNSIYGVSKRLQGFEPPSYVASLLWNAEAWSVA
jgi:peptide/nickel transport system substrate-binding protein